VFPMHAMNPAPAVIAASLVCGSCQTATSAGSLALGCWYNGMMTCTRHRLCGLSGKDQQELVARIEAFYRNGWPGSAKKRHRVRIVPDAIALSLKWRRIIKNFYKRCKRKPKERHQPFPMALAWPRQPRR
jgi:hypothetical protein